MCVCVLRLGQQNVNAFSPKMYVIFHTVDIPIVFNVRLSHHPQQVVQRLLSCGFRGAVRLCFWRLLPWLPTSSAFPLQELFG